MDRCVASLPGRAEPPAVEVSARGHAAGVASQPRADLGEALSSEYGDGLRAAHDEGVAATFCDLGIRNAQLAEAVIAPAVAGARGRHPARLDQAGAQLHELELRCDAG